MNAILAVDNDYGIGKNNSIPWHSKEDLMFFKMKTDNNVVIMGKNTWNSLDLKVQKTFCNTRICIVLSANESDINYISFHNFITCNTINQAILYAKNNHNTKEIFFMGGEQVYKDSYNCGLLQNIYITNIQGNYNCDVHVKFFANLEHSPKWYISERKVLNDNSIMTKYTKIHEEYQYLNLLKRIMNTGKFLDDRTGVGIYSIFGAQIEFDCSCYFPLLTTKKTFMKGIVEELLWFLNGNTDSKLLESKGVNIWKGNTSRTYLDQYGFTNREVGDIGPGYGHQWRHWNAVYFDCHTDYITKGIDQLTQCIKNIEHEKNTKKHNRRNIMLAWNPEQIEQMSLPPCHVLVQFNLNGKYLDLHMYQRSADMFLGVPFNIASYALLLNIIAVITETVPNKLIMSFGDAHIYTNHIDAVKTQLKNTPYTFPKLSIQLPENKVLEAKHITLNNYKSHESIRAPMAV